jgi:hypothetical protein
MDPVDTAVVQMLNRAEIIAMLASKPRALVLTEMARSEIRNLLDILNVLDQSLMVQQ